MSGTTATLGNAELRVVAKSLSKWSRRDLEGKVRELSIRLESQRGATMNVESDLRATEKALKAAQIDVEKWKGRQDRTFRQYAAASARLEELRWVVNVVATREPGKTDGPVEPMLHVSTGEPLEFPPGAVNATTWSPKTR